MRVQGCICASWNSFSDAYICSQTPCQLTALFHLPILCYNIHPSVRSSFSLLFFCSVLFSPFLSSLSPLLCLFKLAFRELWIIPGNYPDTRKSDISTKPQIDSSHFISVNIHGKGESHIINSSIQADLIK